MNTAAIRILLAIAPHINQMITDLEAVAKAAESNDDLKAKVTSIGASLEDLFKIVVGVI